MSLEKKAEEILHTVFNGGISIPIDMSAICKKYDIDCIDVDFNSDEIYGQITTNKNKVVILINRQVHKNYEETRKRFTLAHELGHYFLHLKKDLLNIDVLPPDNAITMSRRKSFWNIQESEANFFAACLLMPPSIIKEKMEKIIPVLLSETDDDERWYKTRNEIKKLANEFEVSPKAMTYLLFDFNWLKSETRDRLIDFFNKETENKQ